MILYHLITNLWSVLISLPSIAFLAFYNLLFFRKSMFTFSKRANSQALTMQCESDITVGLGCHHQHPPPPNHSECTINFTILHHPSSPTPLLQRILGTVKVLNNPKPIQAPSYHSRTCSFVFDMMSYLSLHCVFTRSF